MKLEIEEIRKLYKFLLQNFDEINYKIELFDLKTLIELKKILKGDLPNNFNLKEKEQNLIINYFINSNNVFSDITPSFIIEDEKCAIESIKRNINSIDFIHNINGKMKAMIEIELLKKDYILNSKSPDSIRKNYMVIKKSVLKNVFSADYILWDFLSNDEKKSLLEIILNSNYILTKTSPSFLSENKEVALMSIKRNVDSINYSPINMLSEPDIFKALIINKYDFSEIVLRNRELTYLCDNYVFDYYFNKFDLYSSYSLEFKTRVKKVIYDTLYINPKIEDFNQILESLASISWNNYKLKNNDLYGNVFGKICGELRINNESFSKAIKNFYLLDEMKRVLGKKYEPFYKAIEKYYSIFHSNVDNKLEKLKPLQNQISKSASLYISKSKENYKKLKIRKFQEKLKSNFKIKLDNPIVNKKVIEVRKKQMFKNLYINKDPKTKAFIDYILKKYNIEFDKNRIIEFIFGDISELSDLVPKRFYEFEDYEKTIKLINRLNSGYIFFDGIEVKKYKHLIKYDDKLNIYLYNGDTFSDNEKVSIMNYKKQLKLFNNMKKDIMLRVKEMIVSNEIDENTLEKISNDIPFNDENYAFDNEKFLKTFKFNDLCENLIDLDQQFDLENLLDDESYNNIYNYLVNGGINKLLLILSKNYLDNDEVYLNLKHLGISKHQIFGLIENMDKIVLMAKEFKIDISKVTDALNIFDMLKCADDMKIAILGQNMIGKLCENKEYANEDSFKIIDEATDLICYMSKMSKTTVPYISGTYLNYKYSMYDKSDESILVSGINTDACFKIEGKDHDFLNYCALNKNGFVIKITDNLDNFIARASGFRNGNVVFINQLRTIYDVGGDNYTSGDLDEELNDIIRVFKKSCEDIINLSQNNLLESKKIDFVFVNKSYALDILDSNVGDHILESIGFEPMDNKSDSWNRYIATTLNLKETENNNFTTDFGIYELICMASSIKDKEVCCCDIKLGDVEAIYERKRNKVLIKKILIHQY